MIKVSETLYNAINNFLNFSPQVTEHLESTDNPHGVSKEQVGLGNVQNTSDLNKPVSNAVQTALNGKTDAADFEAHTSRTDNPHSVTKAQAGLSNVDNVKQASFESYNAHIAGNADKHSGEDIVYSEGKSVTDKINELIIDGGAGTMYHNELLNRNLSGAHSIEAITGLRGELGKTLVFTGTTTGADDIYLRCAETDSEFINSAGDLTVPEDKAMAADIKIIGLPAIGSGAIGGMWHRKGLISRMGSVAVPSWDEPIMRYFLLAEAPVTYSMKDKGSASVSTVNALQAPNLGDSYTLTDAGTITNGLDGNLSVSEGDKIIFREGGWDNLEDYDKIKAYVKRGPDSGNNALGIMVKGCADTEIKWRAEVRLTNICSLS